MIEGISAVKIDRDAYELFAAKEGNSSAALGKAGSLPNACLVNNNK